LLPEKNSCDISTNNKNGLTKKILGPKVPAFKEYYRWWFVNTLLRHSMAQAMPLIADTSMANLLLRALGLLELMTC